MSYKGTVFLTSICLLLVSGFAWSTDVDPSQFHYVVNGFVLGGSVDDHTYFEYQCKPSEHFSGFIWCHNRRLETVHIRTVVSNNYILHDEYGKVVYASRYITPVIFGPGEIEKIISLISARYGETARVIQVSSPWRIDRNAVIAIWGQISLEQLDSTVMSILASGRDVNSGLHVDYLGDFRKSAKLGLPVYRIAGGPGYLWSASYDRRGRGHQRFLTSNAGGYLVQIERNKKPSQTELTTTQNDVSSSLKPVTQSDVPENILAQSLPQSRIVDSKLRLLSPITFFIPNVSADQGLFKWAAVMIIVACAIAFSFAIRLLLVSLSVPRTVHEYLNAVRDRLNIRRNRGGKERSDERRCDSNEDASRHSYQNKQWYRTEEYCYSNYGRSSQNEWRCNNGYNESVHRPQNELWYEILDVSADASAEEIKKAWHDKIQKNHPDRVANLDSEFRMLADHRTKRLNNARDQGLSNLTRSSG